MSRSFAPTYKKHWILIIVLTAAFFVTKHYLDPQKNPLLIETSAGNPSLKKEGYFLILHFPRISDKWGSLSKKRMEDNTIEPGIFHDHLKMLQSNGYKIIDLDDVYDFFYRGGKLPKKAVLITLMGFRENNVYAGSILKELGFRALMFLDVESMWEKMYTYISWHTTRNMMTQGLWDIGILARLDQNAAKYKTYAEKKVEGLNVKAVTCSLGVDFEKIKQQYPLVFQHKVSEGYNDGETSPYHLNMLVVSPEWNSQDLKQVLEKTLSRRTHFEDDFSQSRLSLDWLIPWGKAFTRNGKMMLQSNFGESGATSWLLGTQTWDSMSMEAEYKLIRGRQFWIYARFLDDGNYLRFGQEGSTFYLQERTQWGPIRGLKGYHREVDPSQPQRIRFVLRDRYAFAYVNGRRIFRQPLSVDSSLERGKVGFSVWDGELGRAYAQVYWARFKRLPHVWLECSSTEECLRTVRGYSEYVSSISPVWFHLRMGQLEEKVKNYESFNIHHSYFKMALIPTLIFDANSLDRFDFSRFKKELGLIVKRRNFDGLHFDLTAAGTAVQVPEIEKIFRWFAFEYPDLKLGVTFSSNQLKKYARLADLADMVGIKPDHPDLKHLGLSHIQSPVRKRVFLSVSHDLAGVLDDFHFSLTRSVSSLSFIPSLTDDTFINRYQLRGLLLCQE